MTTLETAKTSIFICFCLVLAAHFSLCSKQGTSATKDSAGAKSRPYGFASKVTGGGDAKAEAPPDIETLKSWLEDDKPRVILIDKVFDFSDSEGNETAPGWWVFWNPATEQRPQSFEILKNMLNSISVPWPHCPNGNSPQEYDLSSHPLQVDYCKGHPDAKRIDISYRKAAMKAIEIRSDKSIIGVGNKGVIKGKGLIISEPANNVILQNIEITFLNPFTVWGGDALTFKGAKDVWVDHCTISLIGRQMIGTMPGSVNTGITLSNNLFEGATPWSADCLGQHYWTIILGGKEDQITMADNCFHATSGRSPKMGGFKDGKALVHSFNNYYNTIRTLSVGGFEVSKDGFLLAEANVFDNYGTNRADKKRSSKDKKNKSKRSEGSGEEGSMFVPFKPEEGKICQPYLGRSCVTNLLHNTPKGGEPDHFMCDNGVLQLAKEYEAMKKAPIQPAEEILARTDSQCGAGKMG